VLLTGPLSGAAPWRPRPEPCPGAWSGAVAAAGAWLFLGCGGEPSAGNQLKTAYTSADGGATWHQVASPPFSGYLTSAAMSPGGTIFLSGERMDVYVSGNRGGSWPPSPSLAAAAGAAEAGLPLLATTAAGPFGVVIQQGVDTRQLWLTEDGGGHWAARTVH
jgi:hypothetical protein